MNDACVCIDDGGEGVEARWASNPRARKEHQCGECKEPIRIGEEYEKVNLVFEGEFSTHKTCSICVRIRDEFFKCGYYYGMVWEQLAESWETTEELLLTGKDDYPYEDAEAANGGES